MHELSVMRHIIEIALRHAGDRCVKAVEVEVGRWSNIQSSCLEFYFRGMVPETRLEGAEIRIFEIPLTVNCRECGAQFEPEDMIFYCPACGGHRAEVVSGKELRVKAIEVADED